GLTVAEIHSEMQDLSAFLREQGNPPEAGDRLTVVCRERLPFGKLVAVDAQVPDEMFVARISQPLDTVGENRNSRITDRRAFHGPTRVSDHDLIQRETFLC